MPNEDEFWYCLGVSEFTVRSFDYMHISRGKDFEISHFLNFWTTMTLTLTLDQVTWHNSCSTHWPLPTHYISLKSEKLLCQNWPKYVLDMMTESHCSQAALSYWKMSTELWRHQLSRVYNRLEELIVREHAPLSQRPASVLITTTSHHQFDEASTINNTT